MKTGRLKIAIILTPAVLMLSSCFLFNRNPNTAQRGKRFPHDSDKPKQEKKKESEGSGAKSGQ